MNFEINLYISIQAIFSTRPKSQEKNFGIFRRSFIKRQTNGTSSHNEWQRMTMSDNEWQWVTTSGTTSDKEWQWMTKSDNEWQWVTVSDSSGTTIENGTVHFKEWMIAIISVTKGDALLLQGMSGCN